ncbi:DUF4834 family protein [Sphingobacterium olei]|uniref:DUF4834 family protein n=1 Tax=Sphingobacterium olei TaxID=2571155 RepID=A0A4U0P1P3_9SPHI|nr:DUF4834 family protein [Sphingobacterium olei]TJZ61187.1 DUF4834 family protein [Sphingobacterium olei]
MTFLYFILFTILFYYVFKFSMRLIMPFAMRKLAERMMKKAQQSHQYTHGGQNPFGNSNSFGGYQDQSQSRKPDNKVHVDYVPRKEEPKKNGAATAGEFVDFEEIK